MVQRRKDCGHYTVKVAHDVIIAKTQDTVTLSGNEAVATGIIFDCLVSSMQVSVNLNDQLLGMAHKISVVVSKWNLTTEVQSRHANCPQGIPQHSLRRAHALP